MRQLTNADGSKHRNLLPEEDIPTKNTTLINGETWQIEEDDLISLYLELEERVKKLENA